MPPATNLTVSPYRVPLSALFLEPGVEIELQADGIGLQNGQMNAVEVPVIEKPLQEGAIEFRRAPLAALGRVDI